MILRKANLSNLKVIDNEIIEKFIPNWEEFKDDPSAARIAADYFLGVVMILAFVTSTSLNPLTLLFNYRQGGRLKAVRILFILLSTCDFLTNIYRPLQIGYRFLSPRLYPLIRPGTLTEQVESFIFLVLDSSLSVHETNYCDKRACYSYCSQKTKKCAEKHERHEMSHLLLCVVRIRSLTV